MADKEGVTQREREETLREGARVDTTIRRLFVAAIIALAAFALLLLVFTDRPGSPRVIKENPPANPPSRSTQEPPPTTPAPEATPGTR